MRKLIFLLLLCPIMPAQNNLQTSQTCPCSVFGQSAPIKKTSGPDKAVEVGIRFTSDIDSNVVAVRYYKMPGASGNHFGTVWSNGNVLGTVQFVNETASGWQTQALPVPVKILAGQEYRVSYHTDSGFEALDAGFFTSPVTNGPLHALGGVYSYNAVPKYPAVLTTTNYYADVVLGSYVTLSWDASTTSNVLYNVYRSASTTFDFTKPIAAGLSGLTFQDINVTSGTTYNYVATATLQSSPSNTAVAVIP